MKSVLCIAALLASAGTASAAVWVEVGDAGALPAGAQATMGSGQLDEIVGATQSAAPQDIADYYIIDIKDPDAFSARTDLNPGSMTDTALYLMNLDGTGIIMNDDISGANFRSHIQVGEAAALIAPGYYLLLVTGFGILPAWSTTETPLDAGLVFPFDFPGSFEAQNTTNPHIAYLNGGAYGGSFGSYRVTLTGASYVPTPGAAALMGLGALVAGRRRRA